MSDEQLIAKTLAGDTRRYGELIERYEAPLLRYIMYLIHDHNLAEDILQDTFIKTYANLRGFNRHLKFSSWIYRIAHNTAMDAVKKRQPILLDEPTLDNMASHEPRIAEQIDHEILARDLARCLAELPLKYRAPVALHYLQGKSYEEISDVLRLPVSTVGVRIARAKDQLRIICKRKGVQQ